MANETIREYPAIIKETINGPEIVIGVRAKSIMEAHSSGLAYCNAHGLILSGICMPSR